MTDQIVEEILGDRALLAAFLGAAHGHRAERVELLSEARELLRVVGQPRYLVVHESHPCSVDPRQYRGPDLLK